MNLKDKKVTVFGLGLSGEAVVQRLLSLGAKVFVSEQSSSKKSIPMDVKSEFGGHTSASIENTDLIIVSPGVHLDVPIIEEARKRNIPIIGEIELAYRLLSKPIIAITGTNGKTTTTTLIGEMLKNAGKKIAVVGNIGSPLILVDDSQLDYIIVEVSSYQLETTQLFKPWIALILNITEDHIERHGNMQEYAAAKKRIFMNQEKNDYLIYNAEDAIVSDLVKGAKPKLVPFSKKDLSSLPCKPEEIFIKGEHNLENALAATAAALICRIDPQSIAQTLKTFKGVEHRIEYVTSVSGVEFYNDSKGTNPDSTIVALKTLASSPSNIILILGGRDKGGDLTALCKLVNKTTKEVILLGEAKDRFKQNLEKNGFTRITEVSSLDEAVKKSFTGAKKGDKVLLSPACASFDMFTNFEERGIKFKEAVIKLEQKT